MWITTLLSALFLCMAGYTYADHHEKEVSVQDLPQGIQQFINAHFTGVTMSKACVKDKGAHKVMLSDGYEVEFDHHGNWEEVENELHAALPSSVVALLPQKAVNYLNNNYPNWAVYSIDRNRNGYEVKLHGDSMVELHFDSNGNFLRQKMEN